MQEFEKLGVFYLGKEYELETKRQKEAYVLLKSKDLTTHAVIIGMTGSGKTGLGIGLIEEAMMDNIPVIAIDPKGDLGNLALTFPQLKGEDFKPWINLQEAADKGVDPDTYAHAQADLWKKGLSDWGQDGKRIEMLKNEADVRIFTPGGSAGIGVSVLKSFKAPPQAIVEDHEAFRDRISVTTVSLLSLIGIEADPFTSREFILISNILEDYWGKGMDISLTHLIEAIQKPSMSKIGVMDLESFYPSKDRFSLAMNLNNLVASPGFEAWLKGDALDVNAFLYNQTGKPQVSVFSIAHLSDRERMFFVTMLLNEIIAWMRSQPGTGSLRALVYMDEVFGYLPPTANPPSKGPLLTLLKQARAYGLGLVLSTQNPVDLDYKALSNAGTWFIGRLQTEGDKERVLAGLEGAAATGKFDRRRTEQILAGIGQRIFYLHSIHEERPKIFSSRWVMSYLAGPLTQKQIAALSNKFISKESPKVVEESALVENQEISDNRPTLDPKIKQVFLPISDGSIENPVYKPTVIGLADVFYQSSKYGVSTSLSYTMITPIHEGPVSLDWDQSQFLDFGAKDLEVEPIENSRFSNYPSAAANPKNYDAWKRLFNQHIRTNVGLKLFTCPELKVTSEPGETKRDFRIRIQHVAHEKRDEALETMRKRYASKIQTLENRLQRANQAVEKQKSMASQRKLDAAVSAGSAILGAIFGHKATSISKMGTAARRTSQALKSGQGIDQALDRLESTETQLEALQLQLEQELSDISITYDRIKESVEEIDVRASSTNITVHLIGLAWLPEKTSF